MCSKLVFADKVAGSDKIITWVRIKNKRIRDMKVSSQVNMEERYPTKKIWTCPKCESTEYSEDTVTITGKTHCAELKNGSIKEFSIHPSDLDIPTAKITDILGGEPKENAKEILNLFNGNKGAFRNVVIMNSASALVATGNAKNLEEGAKMSIKSIDEGKALKKLEMLIEMTNS